MAMVLGSALLIFARCSKDEQHTEQTDDALVSRLGEQMPTSLQRAALSSSWRLLRQVLEGNMGTLL